MQDHEQVFDSEIGPALLALAKKCEDLGMPFIAVCQYKNEGTSHTAYVPEGSDPLVRMAYYAAQSKGNVDTLVAAIRRDGEKHGHDSIVLSLLKSLERA